MPDFETPEDDQLQQRAEEGQMPGRELPLRAPLPEGLSPELIYQQDAMINEGGAVKSEQVSDDQS